jgi:F-type H+-transporting ATPase subunit delta
VTNRVDAYAAAIFELAQAEDDTSRVERELYAIARSVETSPELRDALLDPLLPVERKQSVVDNLVGGRASQLTVNLVSFVITQGRASDLTAIAERLSQRVAQSGGADVAEIRSAIPLDEATIQRLSAALSKATGRPVEARTIVDPSLMGGVVARVGDTVIDGSVRSRLQSLRAAMKN